MRRPKSTIGTRSALNKALARAIERAPSRPAAATASAFWKVTSLACPDLALAHVGSDGGRGTWTVTSGGNVDRNPQEAPIDHIGCYPHQHPTQAGPAAKRVGRHHD